MALYGQEASQPRRKLVPQEGQGRAARWVSSAVGASASLQPPAPSFLGHSLFKGARVAPTPCHFGTSGWGL